MLEDLENALAEHAPAGGDLASELPPLTIDGIPVSVDKMTQVRLNILSAWNLSSKITRYTKHQTAVPLAEIDSGTQTQRPFSLQRAPAGNKSESQIVF